MILALASIALRELNNQALAHEFCAVCTRRIVVSVIITDLKSASTASNAAGYIRKAVNSVSLIDPTQGHSTHTRHHILGVHGILVLQEAKALHKFDLCDLASTMRVKMVLDVGLGSYMGTVQSVSVPASMSDARNRERE